MVLGNVNEGREVVIVVIGADNGTDLFSSHGMREAKLIAFRKTRSEGVSHKTVKRTTRLLSQTDQQ
jgi:hypothetical protein